MAVAEHKTWEELAPTMREELDRRFLGELARWSTPGLTDDGVQAYLDYRHQRPDAAITTYEEGQIRKILHDHQGTTREPDPVELEDHVGRIEQIGARRFHLTNDQTYFAVMLLLTFAFFAALLLIAVFL
jgi:hypothetical protein